jgi:hypothetical protein
VPDEVASGCLAVSIRDLVDAVHDRGLAEKRPQLGERIARPFHDALCSGPDPVQVVEVRVRDDQREPSREVLLDGRAPGNDARCFTL